MTDNNVPDSLQVYGTGHKNASSLNNYRTLNDRHKYAISQMLSNTAAGGPSNALLPPESSPQPPSLLPPSTRAQPNYTHSQQMREYGDQTGSSHVENTLARNSSQVSSHLESLITSATLNKVLYHQY